MSSQKTLRYKKDRQDFFVFFMGREGLCLAGVSGL